MIHIQGKVPYRVMVACSGGVDSIAVAHFLSRTRTVDLLFVHHRTEDSARAYSTVVNFAEKYNLNLWDEGIDPLIPPKTSQEEHWRNERYKIFHHIPEPIITCHHLDDCVETWVWSCMHGEGKIIPYCNRNVVRPFRLTKKESFYGYARKHGLSWYEDSSNNNTRYTRNYIRHVMMPHVLHINPGIQKTVARKVRKDIVCE
jgi:tRNA(Ile)-lysidine synthetase, N-terminal domain